MPKISPDTFEDRLLRFSLRIPQAWDFMPPAWSPVAQLKNSGNEDWEWIKRANQPFCCARKLHDHPSHAYPTLQVTVRRVKVPTNAEAKVFLDAQLELLSKQYAGFNVLFATTEAVIAGHRANIIRASFTLFTNIDDDSIALPILSRGYMIFSPTKAFTFGMSSSASEEYYDESDFERIISSVRIGA